MGRCMFYHLNQEVWSDDWRWQNEDRWNGLLWRNYNMSNRWNTFWNGSNQWQGGNIYAERGMKEYWM